MASLSSDKNGRNNPFIRMMAWLLITGQLLMAAGCSREERRKNGEPTICYEQSILRSSEPTEPTLPEPTEVILDDTELSSGEVQNRTSSKVPTKKISEIELKTYESKEEIRNAFTSYYDDSKLSYLFYQDSYNSYMDIDEIRSEEKEVDTCQMDFSNINIDEIKEKILKNSRDYCLYNEEYSPFYTRYGDSEKQDLAAGCLYVYFDEIIKSWQNDKNNINDNLHSLETLKIVVGDLSEGVRGQYNRKENLIIIDLDCIIEIVDEKEIEYQNRIEKYPYSDERFWYNLELGEDIKKTFIHELNHLRQNGCPCQSQDSSHYTLNYIKGYSTFLVETSAESDIYVNDKTPYLDNNHDYSYLFMRENESAIWLLGLFHEGGTLDNYYKAFFDSDRVALHKFLGIENDEDCKEIYDIIFTFDTLNGYGPLAKEIYYSDEDRNLISHKKMILQEKVYINLSSIVFERMVNYTIDNPSYTLEENLLMFKFVRGTIAKNLYLYLVEDCNNYSTNERVFVEMCNKYLEFLSVYYDKPMGEILNNNISQSSNFGFLIHKLDKDTYNDHSNFEYVMNYPDEYSYDERKNIIKIEKASNCILKKFPIMSAIYQNGNLELFLDYHDGQYNELFSEYDMANKVLVRYPSYTITKK